MNHNDRSERDVTESNPERQADGHHRDRGADNQETVLRVGEH